MSEKEKNSNLKKPLKFQKNSPLSRHVTDVAHSAQNLNRLMSAKSRRFARRQFGHRGLFCVTFSFIFEHSRSPSQQSRTFHSQRHLGDFILNCLHLRNWTSEGEPLGGVIDGAFCWPRKKIEQLLILKLSNFWILN